LKNHGPIVLFASDPLMVYEYNALSSSENVQLQLEFLKQTGIEAKSKQRDAHVCSCHP
jgi:hypothetical protein